MNASTFGYLTIDTVAEAVEEGLEKTLAHLTK
jgi:hypothetical protein